MIQDKEKKSARLEARIPPAVYALVQRAAALQGRSVSDFVITAAQRAAEETIEQREIITLSHEDQERFADAMLKPAPLAPAMRRAAKAHRRLIEPS